MTTPIAQGPVDVNVRPVAWMHDQPERYDVVHNEAKALWLKAWPKQVEHYTIPLYRHERREPLSTDAACALLKDALGIDPLLDGNMLKMLRAVERAHGIGPNFSFEAEEIKALREQKKQIQAQAQSMINQIDDKIQRLLCIEHKEVV